MKIKQVPFVTGLGLFLIAGAINEALADPVPVEQRGYWMFEEGAFQGGFGPLSRTVIDSSGLGNHGYRPSSQSRVQYVTDAYEGTYSLEFNSPADGGTEHGAIVIPHDESIEPPTGMVEAQIRIGEFPDGRTIIFGKSTFQFLNREPGPEPPIFYPSEESCSALPEGCPEGRIVGRAVYHLEILGDGRLRAVIANDGVEATEGNGGGPWTGADSALALSPGEWNDVAMSWDGCELSVAVNGVWSDGVAYAPIPELGLSYRGTGTDPTLGEQTLPLALSNGNFVGQVDEFKVSSVEPCADFADVEYPSLPAVEPAELRLVEPGDAIELSAETQAKLVKKKIKSSADSRNVDDRDGEEPEIPGGDCGPLGCTDLLNGEGDDFFRTPGTVPEPFVLTDINGIEITGKIDPQIASSDAYLVVTLGSLVLYYSKDGSALAQVSVKDLFKPLWNPANPGSINFHLNLPSNTPCNPVALDSASRIFCVDSFYDARVVYDSYNERFWITALARNSASRSSELISTTIPHTLEEQYAARRSKLLVAVSKSQDPRDGWGQWYWDAVIDDGACSDTTVDVCPGAFYMPGEAADYPSIGISEKYAVVTNIVRERNLETGDWDNRYQLFHVMEVAGFVSGAGATLWHFIPADPFDSSRLYTATTQPAVHHGLSLHDMAHLGAVTNQHFLIWGLKPPLQPMTAPSLHYVKVPLKHEYLGINDMPQKVFPGGLPSKPVWVTNLGIIAMKASYRDFKLHMIFMDCRSWEPGQIPCSTSNHLVRANVFNFQHGNVPQTVSSGYLERVFGLRNSIDDGANDVIYYGNPAVEVNVNNDIVAVYNRSGSPIYPEARYSAFMHNEPDIRPSALLHEGHFPYNVVFDPTNPKHLKDDGVTPKPVGHLDTGGIAVDPFDDTAIWMLHAFADAPDATKSGKSFDTVGVWRYAVGKAFGESYPDLVVSAPEKTAPKKTVVSPVDSLTLEGVVTNQGTDQAGPSRLRIVLSSDQTVSGSDVELADVIIPGIPSSGTFGFILSASLPPATSPGNYFLLAHIDWNDGVFEYSNDNNFSEGTPLHVVGHGLSGR